MSFQFGMIYGVLGAFGAALLFLLEAIEGRRLGRLETWAGSVTRASRPLLFRYVLAARRLAAAMSMVGAFVLALLYLH